MPHNAHQGSTMLRLTQHSAFGEMTKYIYVMFLFWVNICHPAEHRKPSGICFSHLCVLCFWLRMVGKGVSVL